MTIAIIALVLLVAVQSAILHRTLVAERDRSLELQRILEAKEAPAEFLAYHSADYEVPDPSTWVADDTGLIGAYEVTD